jgi:hypothetical protein
MTSRWLCREGGVSEEEGEGRRLVGSSLSGVSESGLEGLLGEGEGGNCAREATVTRVSGESLQALSEQIALGVLEGELAERGAPEPHGSLREGGGGR